MKQYTFTMLPEKSFEKRRSNEGKSVRASHFRNLAATVVLVACFSGCMAPQADTTLQNNAYSLYGETVATYRNTSPGNYSSRKEFYTNAYNQLDLMEMRARIDVEAPFDDREELSNQQESFIKPIRDLRTALKEAEDMDQDGGFVRGTNLESTKKELARCFYAIIYRQTVGSPKQ